MQVPFVKMVAAGNDFIVIDNRKGLIKNGALVAKKICDRKRSVGGDGILLLERSKTADIRMRIFNPDGSEAEMCGNGVRCLAQFAVDKKITKSQHKVETEAGVIGVDVKKTAVRARLTDPRFFKPHIAIHVNGKKEDVNFIDTGVPHAVVFEDKLENVSVGTRGREIRNHEYFAPKGTNVNFVRIGQGDRIEVRTYERGVEAETLACGTGSTASAIVSASLEGLQSPIKVKTSGGGVLKVYFKNNGDRWEDVYLEGPVETSFEGRVQL